MRMWKNNKAAVRRLWLTHLGSGEGGRVEYIGGTEKDVEAEMEEWE